VGRRWLESKGTILLASDLQVSLPLIGPLTSTAAAARLVIRRGLSGVVVANDIGDPVGVLSSSDVLKLLMTAPDPLSPPDEAAPGPRIVDALDEVDELLTELTHIDADDPLDLVATKMLNDRAEVALVDQSGPGARFVTLPTVIGAILAERGEEGAG
jgi:CBS domain-containing protein